ncbi:Chymotrypsin-like elastase member 2A [Desmophyllum pertusum]|uniref:Chymotrypsin-like elastase member 2A n=1 Tax=Desmophyllum pertusum TaxID=174260 RepID=A0A9W9ZPT6_9CNID|nr:Chymotrypsin-like elastase member 2A [Desmophyllum pertusum]
MDRKGYCYAPKYFDLMKIYCEKTCNLCDVTTPEPPPIPVQPGNPLGECGKSVVPQGRVIGGTDALHGSWPWQVGLYRGDGDSKFFCGGSLIRPDWVVTAAHCIKDKFQVTDYRVRVGDWHRFYPDGTEQVRNASKLIKHSQHNHPSPANNDIALIKLERPVMLNSHVNTICLPQRGVDVAINSKCYITGWGKVKHPGAPYYKLQQAQLPLVSNAECSAKAAASPPAARLNITPQMVCAGDLDPSDMQGGCHGDSGGPFVCKDSTSGKFVLEGAVSWGSTNCNFVQQNKQYTVFARVSEFRDWIDQQIALN